MIKLFILSTLLLLANLSYAQGKITVNEANASYSSGSYNSIIITVPFANEEVVIKMLKSEFKSWKGKLTGKDEYTITEGKLKALGKRPFNAYGKVLSVSDGNIKFAVAFQLEGSIMTSSDFPLEIESLKAKLRKLGVEMAQNSVKEELKAEAKSLQSLEKEQNTLLKNKERMEAEIESYMQRIEENKQKITTNISNQELKKQEIEKQKLKVGEIENNQKSIK